VADDEKREPRVPVGGKEAAVATPGAIPRGWKTREEYLVYMREYMRKWRARKRGEK